MNKSPRLLVALTALGLAVSACASNNEFGRNRDAPDEFAVVTKAPLTLPPDFALRPPRPGETRPQEKSPSERAQQLLIGDESAAPPTDGELALIQAAGALTVDPNIRSILGAENGGWAEKDESLTNRLIFWRVSNNQIDDSAAPLRVDDPEDWLANRRRSIENVTAGEQVIIAKSNRSLRLPGVR
ncbi:MAG: DUF3035 domain-containing protein [Aquisalinus sp.]|nr:DUF3035 domain-containing protein [Aquisalinus sp.]